MTFVCQDFQHRYQPFYSEPLKCDTSLGLNMVIPTSFYKIFQLKEQFKR